MSNVYPNGPEFALLLFSSHSWAHGHHREGLHDLLSSHWKKGTEFHDYSVPEAHPLHYGNEHDRLVDLLADRISRCDVVLAMAGIYASHSYWMSVEIRLAHLFGKPILAVAPNGQQRLSRAATSYSQFDVVRWRGDSLRSAILLALPFHVRDDFLAAKAWRQKIAAERVIRHIRRSGLQRFNAFSRQPSR